MTTPAGLWNVAEARLATMLSTLATFQTFCGVATSAAALARVYYEGMAEPANVQTGQYTLAEMTAKRPCAIVSAPDRKSWSAKRVAEQRFVTSGQLVMILLRSVATTHHGLPTADDVTVYKNLVGPIIAKTDDAEPDGLLDLPWESPNLATREIYLEEGPYWGDPEAVQDEGVWLGSTWIVEW